MSPLEAALSQLVFYNQSFDTIMKAVLVEADGPASQVGAIQTILGAITQTRLTVYTANLPSRDDGGRAWHATG